MVSFLFFYHYFPSLQGAVVKDFGGRSLSMGVSSSFIVNPDIPEAHQLSGWFSEAASTLKVGEMKDIKSQTRFFKKLQ